MECDANMRNIFEINKGKSYFCRKEKNMRKEKNSYLFKEFMKPEIKWYKDPDFFLTAFLFIAILLLILYLILLISSVFAK